MVPLGQRRHAAGCWLARWPPGRGGDQTPPDITSVTGPGPPPAAGSASIKRLAQPRNSPRGRPSCRTLRTFVS